MIDKHITVDAIRWRNVLPWLYLFRAAQLALRARVIIVALLAVLIYGVGCLLMRSLVFFDGPSNTQTLFSVLEEPIQSGPYFSNTPTHVTLLHIVPDANSVRWLSWVWRTVNEPATELFVPRHASWSRVATAWTQILWSLLIWAVFGGAMARLIAVRFARDESVSLRTALKFSFRNWQSYLYGPLLPMLGVGLFAIIGRAIASIDLWLSGGSGTLLNVLGFVPLGCGFLMTLLLLLMAVSWPLMVAAISTEGSDGFDGLSRAFGYVMNRPWYLLWLIAMAWGVGHILNGFVYLIVSVTQSLTPWYVRKPNYVFWPDLLRVTHLAVLVSYFWSATTVIYFLLRQSEDGTPLDLVYIPSPPPKPEPLPVVGVAASEQPVIEQPVIERPQADAGEVAMKS